MLALLVHSQLMVAGSAAAFVYTGTCLGGGDPPFDLLFAAFAGAWVIYLTERGLYAFSGDLISAPERHRFLQRNGFGFLILAIICCLVAVVRLPTWLTTAKGLYWMMGLGVAGVGYALPVIPAPGGFVALRDLGGLKGFLISAAWVAGGLYLPIAAFGYKPHPDVERIGAVLGLLLLADCLELDWRDAGGDARTGRKTVPAVLGKGSTRWLFLLSWLGAAALGGALILGGDLDAPSAVALGTMIALAAIPALLHARHVGDEPMFEAAVALWRFGGAVVLLLFRSG
ncbi:hypothetical protein HZA57_03960 [Candidatus Poribacteria bacterium]|nr:hypothetical protein [Candidatus Poribacteria bacterium]